ncbi:hypothetical protein LARI1_G005247, partial [Lachnellula arida]
LEDEYDKTAFLQPLDADNTKASIYYTRRKWIRYYKHKKLGSWQKALLAEKCSKGKMIGFLRWICEVYIVPKSKRGKRGKRKSVNQYWRDFKMLYRRVNSSFVDANDSYEVVKYINGELKVDYDLDEMPKPKPLAGVNTLLLLLIQHWARDESAFRTEDNRLDFPLITLFLAYTGGRPAEFVYYRDSQPSMHLDQAANDYSDYEDNSKDEIPNKDLFDDNPSLPYDDVDLSDSNDEDQTNGCNNPDSGHSSDRNRFIIESKAESYLIEVNEGSNPALLNLKNVPLAGFKERRI